MPPTPNPYESPRESHSADEAALDIPALRRKIAWRIVPLVLLLYFIAYLDRANAAFANLTMQTELKWFTPEVFGWGVSTFFVGYLLLEIPGALLVERWSARKWFARILFTWGLASMGLAFVRTPTQFYVVRFLLGLAEAGFFPGVVVYFTHWFPRADRGRALSGMVLGVPVSLACGSAVSGLLLERNWFGLSGWQWMFLVEGMPAVLLGVIVPFVLTDRPRDARWLTPREREWLESTLERERLEKAKAGGMRLRDVLQQPTVWLLALGIFLTNTGGYGVGYWLPSVVKNLVREKYHVTTEDVPPSFVLVWTAVIYLCGLVGVLVSGQLADRKGNAKWLCVAGQVAAGGCLAASVLPGQSWTVAFAWFCAFGFFAYFWPSPFWLLPTLSLSADAAAVSIGFINICANVAGTIGSPVFARLKAAGYEDRVGLYFLAACYALGGVAVAFLRQQRKDDHVSTV